MSKVNEKMSLTNNQILKKCKKKFDILFSIIGSEDKHCQKYLTD